jgi:hypothetical protein
MLTGGTIVKIAVSLTSAGSATRALDLLVIPSRLPALALGGAILLAASARADRI